MRSHTIGTSITELAQVWASTLQMGSGTVSLPCEAYKATDVLKFHWTLLFCCYPVIPGGTVSSANYSWMLIMLILLWCKAGRGDSPPGPGPGQQLCGNEWSDLLALWSYFIFYTVDAVCLLTWWVWKLLFFPQMLITPAAQMWASHVQRT